MTGKAKFLLRGIVTIVILGTLLTFAFTFYDGTSSTDAGIPDDNNYVPDDGAGGAIDGGAEPAESDSQGSFLDGGLPWGLGLAAFLIGSSAVLVTLYARLSTDDVLEGVRKDIYEHIEHNPGDHLAGITRKFGISSSSARHHLDVLEWSEMIVSHKTEKFRHYYPNRNGYRVYTNGLGYKEIMAALHNHTSREIVKFLMTHERANQTGIAGALGLHASTVNWHAKRLIAANVISRMREGKDIHYSLNRELDLARVLAAIEGENPAIEDAAPAIEGASS